MTDTSLNDDVDRDSLEPLLGTAQDGGVADLDALFAGVSKQIATAEKKPAFRLKSQASSTRRMLGVLGFLMVVGLTLVTGPRADLADYPPHLLAMYLGSFAVLVLGSITMALRPLHRPALEGWRRWAFPILCVVATFGLVLIPGVHDHVAMRPGEAGGLLSHATPCATYGFALGLPIYALLRLLDRGDSLGRLHAACAAGLAGNVVLELHCPVGGSSHLLAGHAMVLVVYVGGMMLIEWALRMRPSK